MFLAALVFFIGLSMLVVAADHLVLGAKWLAEWLGVAPVVVGVVVIGFGTSAPELLVTATAVLRDQGELAAANLVGSNVINLTLILGIAGLVGPLAVCSTVLRREAPISVGAVILFTATLLTGPGPIGGVLLAVALIFACMVLIRAAKQVPGDPEAAGPGEIVSRTRRLSMVLLRVSLGLAGTLIGATLLVSGAEDLATMGGIPRPVIGFTLVAIGTSLPELMASVQAARRGHVDLLVGNLLGSNILNSMAGGAILGLGSVSHHGLPVPPAMAITMSVTALLAWAFLCRRAMLTRPESAALIAIYLLAFPLMV